MSRLVLNTSEILKLDRIKRLRLINSMPGIKSINLIVSKSQSGINNISLVNSVSHVGSDPPLMAFINRPDRTVKRDTLNNLIDNPFFTINSVEKEKLKNAHLTSGKYAANISEFKSCKLKEHYIDNFPIPFVFSSRVKIGLEVVEKIKIKSNGSWLIIGLIKVIDIPSNYLSKDKDKSIGSIGLNTYYEVNKLCELEYVRVDTDLNS